MSDQPISSSFRDPNGFVFLRGGSVLRQVNAAYREDYETAVEAGLFETLWKKNLLIRHEELEDESPCSPDAYKILRPVRVPFVSHPFEWPFSAYKDAALATLKIQREALKKGFTLKDASAYNIQFLDGRPLLIDTLSFERQVPGSPWIAYRQFCQHFLAPLALMSRRDIRLGQMMRDFIDGVPLDLADRLLGWKARLSFPLYIHIHLHAGSQKKYSGAGSHKQGRVGPNAMKGILDNLASAISGMKWKPEGTEWADYYTFTNYTDAAFENKRRLVEKFIVEASPRSVWDLGANNGEFSRVASSRGIPTVAFDIDPAAVDKNYRRIRAEKEANLLPLVNDLTNPSPSLGWANSERDGLVARGPVDTAMALALIHHLAISNNVPLERIAAFLASICRKLIIEFVPKDDSQVQKLLSSRKDIFPDYTIEGFSREFAKHFRILRSEPIEGSGRTLHLLERI